MSNGILLERSARAEIRHQINDLSSLIKSLRSELKTPTSHKPKWIFGALILVAIPFEFTRYLGGFFILGTIVQEISNQLIKIKNDPKILAIRSHELSIKHLNRQLHGPVEEYATGKFQNIFEKLLSSNFLKDHFNPKNKKLITLIIAIIKDDTFYFLDNESDFGSIEPLKACALPQDEDLNLGDSERKSIILTKHEVVVEPGDLFVIYRFSSIDFTKKEEISFSISAGAIVKKQICSEESIAYKNEDGTSLAFERQSISYYDDVEAFLNFPFKNPFKESDSNYGNDLSGYEELFKKIAEAPKY